MNVGIDIGWTIKGVRPENNQDKIAPDSFRVIKRLVQTCGGKVFLISKVNSAQRERCEKWLKDTEFFEQTGVKPENLYFCFERKDKSLFVKALNINFMIDDRAEVMAHISPLVVKFLINPEPDDLEKHRNHLFNTVIVNDWLEIERRML